MILLSEALRALPPSPGAARAALALLDGRGKGVGAAARRLYAHCAGVAWAWLIRTHWQCNSWLFSNS